MEWGKVPVNPSPGRERSSLCSSALNQSNPASNHSSQQPTPILSVRFAPAPKVSRWGPLGGKANFKLAGCQENRWTDPLAGQTAMEQQISPVKYFKFKRVIALISTEDFFFFFLKEGKWNYHVELIGKPLYTPTSMPPWGSATCNTFGNGFIIQGDDVSLGRSAVWGGTEGMHYTDSVGTQPSKLLAPGTEQKATSVCFTVGSQQTQNQAQAFHQGYKVFLHPRSLSFSFSCPPPFFF